MKLRAILPTILALATCATAQDRVHFKDGHVETGLVTEMTGGFLVLRPPTPGQPLNRIAVDSVITVQFGTRPEMERALAAEGMAKLELLRRVWYLLRPSIDLPESPAGQWGLDFAAIILHSEIPDHVNLSFEVYQTIESRDWNRDRRNAARRGRFNAMLNLGMIDEAMAEARKIATDPTREDPELLILAKMMLGDLAFKELRALEQENPRWDIDDEVRPQRDKLFDTAMDHYLYAHLYHGDRPDDAARGLWAAIQVLDFDGEKAAARDRAADLCLLYPGTPEAKLAEPMANAPAKSNEPTTTPSENKKPEKIPAKPPASHPGGPNKKNSPTKSKS